MGKMNCRDVLFLSSIHWNIEFALKAEHSNSLPYLHVGLPEARWITGSHGVQKPTHTDLYFRVMSDHPLPKEGHLIYSNWLGHNNKIPAAQWRYTLSFTQKRKPRLQKAN
jgi:hypothetical protein